MTPSVERRGLNSLCIKQSTKGKGAMQASLTQTRPPAAQLARMAQAAAQTGQLALTGPVVATPGLQNQIGEYNCFLNVVIQCLWHCREFQSRFSSLAQDNPAIIQVRKDSVSMRAKADQHHPQFCSIIAVWQDWRGQSGVHREPCSRHSKAGRTAGL